MKISIANDWSHFIVTADDGSETVSLAEGAIEQRTVVPAKTKPLAKVPVPQKVPDCLHVNDKHPYVVHVAGVPLFSTSSLQPSRVLAMVGNGIPVELIHIVDTRSGAVYGVHTK